MGFLVIWLEGFISSFLFFKNFMSMGVSSACMSVRHLRAVLEKTRREHQISRTRSTVSYELPDRSLKPGVSERAAGRVLN